MPRIAFLLYPGFTALDAIGPYEVLSRLPRAKVSFVAKQAGPVVTDTGALTVLAGAGLAEVPAPDVLVVPGGLLGSVAAAKDLDLVEWVRTMHASSQWTTSVCTGALLLGAAGLLQGRTATTHWAARHRLARYGATYVPERIVPHDRLITAAGVSAGIDMALYLASRLVDVPEAEALQLLIEYAPEPPFDSGMRATARPETVERAGQILRAEALRDAGRRAWAALGPGRATRPR